MPWMMKLSLLVALLVPALADAATVCYRRDYSDAHLERYPGHIIDLLELALPASAARIGPSWPAVLRVRFTDYDDPFAVFYARPSCSAAAPSRGLPIGTLTCRSAEGGTADILFDRNDAILLSTDRFEVMGGEGDGGGPEAKLVADADNEGARFRLYAVDPSTCATP